MCDYLDKEYIEKHKIFYKKIQTFIENKDCSDYIKNEIKTHIGVNLDRKMYLLTNDNCFLIGLKKHYFLEHIKRSNVQNYMEIKTFDNDNYISKEIKEKQKQEQFIKIKEKNINDENEFYTFENHYKNLICLIIEPSEEDKIINPLWNVFYINTVSFSGPFTSCDKEYYF